MKKTLSNNLIQTSPSADEFALLKDLGLIKISGMDATKFLQGQLTCNVETLTSEAKLAAHCNPQGRVISLFYIFKHQDAFYLCLPHDMVTLAINALKKYAVFFKAQLEDITTQLYCIASNVAINEIIGKIAFQEIAPNLKQTIYICLQSFDHVENTTLSNQWKAQRLQEKIPAVYTATSAKFLPHELNLPSLGAVDFQKGCYTGQEIIARMHYRGKLKTDLVCEDIQTNKAPALGEDIFSNGKACGSIVDACPIENGFRILKIITKQESE